MVYEDHLTKSVQLNPLNTKTAEEVAQYLRTSTYLASKHTLVHTKSWLWKSQGPSSSVRTSGGNLRCMPTAVQKRDASENSVKVWSERHSSDTVRPKFISERLG